VDAVGERDGLLEVYQCVLLDDLLVLGAEKRGDGLGEDVEVGLPSDLLRLDLGELLVLLVDEDVFAVGVFEIDGDGGVLEDGVQVARAVRQRAVESPDLGELLLELIPFWILKGKR